jgi:glycerol-3-phosphate dehydrogenase subunit C
VHFLRFELDDEMVQSLKYGVALALGIDHPNYQAEIGAVGAGVRASLARDLD